MFFSRGVEDNLCNQISRLLGFQKVQDLGTYMGTLLFHKRVTNATMGFIVEKARAKLCSCDARKLSIARRFTLAQSVLLTIPNYFM